MSGGLYCHLLPVDDWGTPWLSYLKAMRPDIVLGWSDEMADTQLLESLGILTSHEDANGAWRGSPLVPAILEADPDSSWEGVAVIDPAASERPAEVSELQTLARYGDVTAFSGVSLAEAARLDTWRLQNKLRIGPIRPGTTFVQWLAGQPEADVTDPESVRVHTSPIELTTHKTSPGVQTIELLAEDPPLHWMNRIVVVGDAQSLPDLCLFWNLRANRPLRHTLPVWLSPSQLTHPEVISWLKTAIRLQSPSWYFSGKSEAIHLISATLDCEPISALLKEYGIDAIGYPHTAWPDFFDANIYPNYLHRSEIIYFHESRASIPVRDSDFPGKGYVEVMIDVDIPRYKLPPGNWSRAIFGSLSDVDRRGLYSFQASGGSRNQSTSVLNLGFSPTAKLICVPLERRGFTIRRDRKSSLAQGLHRLLAFDGRACTVFRSHAVIDLIRNMAERQQGINRTAGRYVPGSGYTFGDVQRDLGSQPLAERLLQWMLRGHLVFRGLKIDCRECGTLGWYPLQDVGAEFRCMGCRSVQPFFDTPNNARWVYRVNEQLAASVDQGVLQEVLFADEFLRRRVLGHDSYLMPNLTVGRSGAHPLEIDLFGFGGGELLLVECKAGSSAGIDAQLQALRTFGESLDMPFKLILVSAADDSSDASLADEAWFWDRVESGNEAVAVENDRLLAILRD
ncbi:MAG: hypothetical protein IT303_10690 [Dehalococcoidia bacterium]|nr:hypothetical protein [Dehalococcoidia bacterium]